MAESKGFKYLVTRPYWNSNSHPEEGEVSKEWIISHFCYVYYNRELSEEEIEKYQIIPTYKLERMVGHKYTFLPFATVKVVEVNQYNVTVVTEDDGFVDTPQSYNAMDIYHWSKDWKQIVA